MTEFGENGDGRERVDSPCVKDSQAQPDHAIPVKFPMRFLKTDRTELLSTCGATACFLAIAVVMLHKLGAKSLWYDETISAFYTKQSVLTIAKMSLLDHVPPLYYWLLKVYSHLFGEADYTLRLFSVFSNLGAAVFLWKLGRAHFDRRTSFYALILFGASNYLLFRAQVARPYSLFLFFTMGSIYYFFHTLDDDRVRWWILYSLCLLCSLYTLYLAVATVAVFAVLACWMGARELSKWHLKCALWTSVSLIGFLPWAVLLMRNHPSRHADWFPETSPSGNLLRDFIGLSNRFFETGMIKGITGGLGGFLPTALFLSVIGLLCIYSLAAWRNDGKAKRMLLFICAYFMLSVLVNLTLNIFASVDFPTAKRFISLCPFAYLIVAAGISRLPIRPLQVLLLVILIVPNAAAMKQTYAAPSAEDWRGVARYVEENWQADDLVIFTPGYMNIAFDYYSRNERRAIGYPKGLMDPARMYWGYHYMRGPDEAERFLLQNATVVRESRRIWLIQSHNVLLELDKVTPDTTMLVALENSPHARLRAFESFYGIHVFLFSNEYE